MKKLILAIGLAVLLVFVLTACSDSGKEAAAADATSNNPRSITIVGTSEILVSPSMAFVNIGVTTFSSKAADAQNKNAEKMEQVFDILLKLGIKEDDMKTTAYYISAHYDYNNNSSRMTGYDVTNSIQVTVRDLSLVSEVLDKTVEQGANLVNSISFGITEEEKENIYNEALVKALASAKTKAGALAESEGITLTIPARITEGTPEYVIPTERDFEQSGKAEDATTPISGGTLKVKASVTAVYEY